MSTLIFAALLIAALLMSSRVVIWARSNAKRRKAGRIHLLKAFVYNGLFLLFIITDKRSSTEEGWGDLGEGLVVLVWIAISFIHLLTLWTIAEIGLWRDRKNHSQSNITNTSSHDRPTPITPS